MEWLRGKNSLDRRVGCRLDDLTEEDVVCEAFVAVSAWEELEVELESILTMVGSIKLTR